MHPHVYCVYISICEQHARYCINYPVMSFIARWLKYRASFFRLEAAQLQAAETRLLTTHHWAGKTGSGVHTIQSDMRLVA